MSISFIVVASAMIVLQYLLLRVSSRCMTTPTIIDIPTNVVVRVEPKDTSSSVALPLWDLVDSEKETSCIDSKHLVTDRRLKDTTSNNFIPNVLHVTTKSRCLPAVFANILQEWKDALPDHSFALHNDAAVWRLLEDDNVAEEFPLLRHALDCRHASMAQISDIWRAILLYRYGGFYTDLDNAPGPEFSVSYSSNMTSAWFVVEEMGYLSQYVLAAPPRHPLTYLLVQATLSRMWTVSDVDHQYVPYTTGPGALKEAWMHYTGLIHNATQNQKGKKNGNNAATKVKAGLYSFLNSTVRVVGQRSRADAVVRRNVIRKKRNVYKESMDMTHFSRVSTENARHESCWERSWRKRQENGAI